MKSIDDNEAKLDNQKDNFKLIRKLKRGDHFGEIALINNSQRTLGIRACENDTILLMMNRDAFTRILGSIEMHLKLDY